MKTTTYSVTFNATHPVPETGLNIDVPATSALEATKKVEALTHAKMYGWTITKVRAVDPTHFVYNKLAGL